MRVPVDFPMYGWTAARVTWRWLDFFEADSAYERMSSLWLGHSVSEGDLLVVRTIQLDRFAAAHVGSGGDVLRELAFAGAFALINRTAPALHEADADRYWKAVVRHIEAVAAGYAAWPVESWFLSDATLPARIWEHAGGWTGFAIADWPIAIGVEALGIHTRELRLGLVSDSEPYGFDLESPIGIDALGAGKPLHVGRRVHRGRLHPDQARLLEQA